MAETETSPKAPVICAACVELLREIDAKLTANLDVFETLAFVRSKIAEYTPPKPATVPVTLPTAT